jgi:hypothetical protein
MAPCLQALAYADIVVKMEEGRVTYIGCPGTATVMKTERVADELGPAQGSTSNSNKTNYGSPLRPKGVPSSTKTPNMSPLLKRFEELSSQGVSRFVCPSKRLYSFSISHQKKSSSILTTTSSIQNLQTSNSVPTKPVKLIEDEDRIEGRVKGAVYR